MSFRPSTSGLETVTRTSNLPGLSSALSKSSNRFVAPITMMPSFWLKPSISESSWLIVWFANGWSEFETRFEPTESISSMKTIHGALFLARSKTIWTIRILKFNYRKDRELVWHLDPQELRQTLIRTYGRRELVPLQQLLELITSFRYQVVQP